MDIARRDRLPAPPDAQFLTPGTVGIKAGSLWAPEFPDYEKPLD